MARLLLSRASVVISLFTVLCAIASSEGQPLPLRVGSRNVVDYSGYWEGTLFQEPDKTFGFALTLQQVGSTVFGYSRIWQPDTPYYGVMQLFGVASTTGLSFQEGRIIEQRTGWFFRWCIKKANLSYDPVSQTLRGPWEAPWCSPGTIQVQKRSQTGFTPVLHGPLPNAFLSSTPSFTLSTAGAAGTSLKYKIVIEQSGSVVRVFDQTVDTTGWSKNEYGSNEIAVFNIPPSQALPPGSYEWYATAYDGANWSNHSVRLPFHVDVASLDWLTIENGICKATISLDRACVTSLYFKPGSNSEIVAIRWGSNLIDLGSLRPELQTGWVVEHAESTPDSAEIWFRHPSGYSYDMQIRWSDTEVSVHCNITCPQVTEIWGVLYPGGATEWRRDKWAYPTETGVETGYFTYPGPHSFVFPPDGSYRIPAEPWIALWDEQVDEVYGYTMSGDVEARFDQGAAADPFFRLPQGTSRLSFHIVKPKPSVPYEAIQQLAIPNDPPTAPELKKPAEGETVRTLPFNLQVSSTDPNRQRLRYRVEILQGEQVVRTHNQTVSTEEWDAPSYRSGSIATLTVSDLPDGTYSWRAYAYDGRAWSQVSETRTFVLSPEVRWELPMPFGKTLPYAIFGVQASVRDTERRLQYRIEVSPDPTFSQNVIAFDQSIDSKGWSAPDYGDGETAKFVALYPLPEQVPLYWRARVKQVGQTLWSEPSPSQSFEIVRPYVFIPPERIRVGRTERIPFSIVNPGPVTEDFVVAFQIRLTTAEVEGVARIVDSKGEVLHEIVLSRENELLAALTPPVEPGVHTLFIEIETKIATSRYASQRLLPAVVLGGAIVASAKVIIIAAAIETGCQIVAKHILRRQEYTEDEADLITTLIGDTAVVLMDAWTQRTIKGSKSMIITAVGKLADKAGEKGLGSLVRKFVYPGGAKVTHFLTVAWTVDSCMHHLFGWSPLRSTVEWFLRLVFSWDPNMKMGVASREGFIQPVSPLPYRVLFENLPSATAAAQEVLITDVLDENLDLSTFAFTEVNFGNRTIKIDPPGKQINVDVDLRPEGRDMVVQIRGALDEKTRTVRVHYKGIDPNTGDLHPDGFLPPNQSPPQGEGYVAFEVGLKEDLPSGTQIKNTATIVFDANPPIETNEVMVTIDSDNPTSRVTEISGVSVNNGGRCADCGVQQTGNIQVRFEASDPVSGIDTVQLWMHEERVDRANSRSVVVGEKDYRPAATVLGSAESGFKVRGKFGYNYRFYTIARDLAGNRELEPEDSDARITVGVPPTLPTGLRMVAVPVQSEESDPKAVFGFAGNAWARYDPTANGGAGGYAHYGSAVDWVTFAQPAQVPGSGYWVKLDQQTVPRVFGPLPDESQPFVIALRRGWNQIGNPWLVDLTWDTSQIKVRTGSQEKPLNQLQIGEGIEPYLWRWDGSSYRLVYDNNVVQGVNTKLPAWEGAWVFAYTDCQLVLPPLVTNGASHGRAAVSRREERGRGWTIPMVVNVGNHTSRVWIGATSAARDVAIGLPPAPPMETGDVRMFVVNGGSPLAVDVRAESRANKPWEIEVHVPAGEHDTATLWWQDVHRAPRGVNPVLVDLQTGERKFLRTASAHTFAVSRQGGVYKFRVELLPEGQLLRISQVRVSGGRSQGSYTVSFSVNAGAQVEVNVLSAGKVIRRLASTVTRSAGVQQVTWDGRDSNGIALPAGAYLVEVKAVSTDGQVVRATTPLVLTR